MTFRRLLLALSLAAVTTVLPNGGTASAQPFGPGEEAVFAEAAAYWGTEPVGCASLTKELVPPGSIDQYLGTGEILEGVVLRPTDHTCDLFIIEGLAEARLCYVMRHEYGHLVGQSEEDLANLPSCVYGVTPKQAEREELLEAIRHHRERCPRKKRARARRYCWKLITEMQKEAAVRSDRG